MRCWSAMMALGCSVVIVLSAHGLQPDKDKRGPAKENPRCVIETSMGTIKIELYQDKAPVTVENFLKYVDAKHYDGVIFHRVIADFMIQGGGFEPGLKDKKGKFA